MQSGSGIDRSAGCDRPLVLVCDASADRVKALVAYLASIDAELQVADLTNPFVPSASPRTELPGVAIVSLSVGPDGPADDAIAAIHRLAAANIRVIAIGEQADRWPLGIRCGALLAGAAAIVDGSRTDVADELRARVRHALDAEAARRREHSALTGGYQRLGVIGSSDAMLGIFRWATRVSSLSDLHVLVTGETGTGKQLLAQAIHAMDPKRASGPFVAVNCGAISPGLAESELFGHRRGAFTGAERHRKGLVRAADGGVLFLDEVGELDPALQTKFLRVLQDGRVLGVGDDAEVPVSVRVIAATNRNLEEMVQQRTFRADLFHRLNVLATHIPPLRERSRDVAPLVAHFLAKHAQLRPGVATAASAEFIAALAQDELAGNARELENIVRRALVHKDDNGPLGLADLPTEILARAARTRRARSDAADGPPAAAPSYVSQVLTRNGWNLSKSLASCERSLVEAALHAADGNQSRTARLLGITPRSVYNKMRKHRLANDGAVSGAAIPERPFRSQRSR